MRYLPLLLCCFGVFSAKAQDTTLKAVEVHAHRVPTDFSKTARSITVISQEDILLSNATNLQEVLAYTGGIDLRQRGPNGVQADVGIRGGSFDQTLILINGMKVSDPQTGHHNLNLPINWQNVERIEILKGPGARIYGPNAYAGAINIITKPGKEKALFLGGILGSKDLYQLNGSVNFPIKNYRQFISLQASGADSFRYNTDFNQQHVFYHGQWAGEQLAVDVMGGLNWRKFGANGFYGASSYNDQYEETESYFGAIQATWQVNDRLSLRGNTYYRQHHDHWMFLREDPSFFENIHQTNIAAIEMSGTYKAKKATWHFGVDSRQEQINSSNLGDRSRQIYGAFINYNATLGKRFTLNPGLNLTFIGNYDPVLFPGLDMGYAFGKYWTLFANTGASFRVPTFTDLYYVGPENIGNTDLQPEKAWTHEVGIKRMAAKWQFSTALFWRDAQNSIEWVRSNDSTQWQPRNFLSINTYGSETMLQWNPASKNIHRVKLQYNYLYSDFLVEEDFASKYQMDYLQHQLIMQVNHKIHGAFHHNVSLRYIKRFGMTDYWLLDSRVWAMYDNWQFFIEATNLLNVQYREAGFVPMPGRWIRLGVKFNQIWE